MPIYPRLAGRVYRLANADDAPLRAGRSSLVFLMQRTWQDNIGVAGRLAHKEVNHRVVLDTVERLFGEAGVRQGDDRVEADGEQALDLAGVHQLDDLFGGVALARQLRLGDAPNLGDILAMLRVLDVAVAGKLIALVAVLAPALTVALAGNRSIAAAGPPDASSRQHQVNAGEDIFHALRMVFDAARMEQEAGLCRPPHLGGLYNERGVHARELPRDLRRVLRHRLLDRLKAGRVVVNELLVYPAPRDDNVQNAVHQGRVAAGTYRKMQVGGAGQRGYAWVNHDQFRAPVARPPDIIGRDRGALGHVGPGHQDHVGERNIVPIVGRAVNAECLFVARPRRDHAEPPVVVQVFRLQGHARKFAHQIGFLVGERHAGEHGEGILAVLLLDTPDLGDRRIQRLVPTNADKAPVRALERMQQAVRMLVLHVALDALGAELAPIEWKVLARLKPDDLVILDLEVDSALLSAEAAVRGNQLIRLALILPASGRRIVRMRAVFFNNLFNRQR